MTSSVSSRPLSRNWTWRFLGTSPRTWYVGTGGRIRAPGRPGGGLDRQRGEPLADCGRELEPVPGARRADHDPVAPLEDEALVGGGRVHAGLGSGGLRVVE